MTRACRRCRWSSGRKARSTSSSNAPLLLYDGTCGFCAASIQFILRHERRHVLRFAALEGDAGRQVRGRHPELASAETMIWVDDPGTASERVQIRSDAAMRIGRYMGGVWSIAATFGTILPRAIRDAAYDFIARHRHRLVRQADRCYMPPPALRARFVDPGS